jgi:anti-anti-sigma regulatory factor
MSLHALLFQPVDNDLIVAPSHLGLAAAPDFVRRVRAVFADVPGRRLVVDLAEVRTMDPRMVSPLLRAHRYARSRGGELHLVPPPSGVLGAVESVALRPVCEAV